MDDIDIFSEGLSDLNTYSPTEDAFLNDFFQSSSDLSSDIPIQSEGSSEDDNSPTLVSDAFTDFKTSPFEVVDDELGHHNAGLIPVTSQIEDLLSSLQAGPEDLGDDSFCLEDVLSGNPKPKTRLDGNSAFSQNSLLPPLPEIKSSTNRDKQTTAVRKAAVTSKQARAFTELSHEQVLSLSSVEIEAYIKNMRSHKTLSQAQEKELKRIRRLIKNREYAQNSRDKKRSHLELVESEMSVVKDENAALKQRVSALEIEKSRLEETVRNLRSIIQSDPIIQERITLLRGRTAEEAEVPAPEASTVEKPRAKKRQRSGFVGGTGLFVVLFSVAILFSIDLLPGPTLPGGVEHRNKGEIITKAILGVPEMCWSGAEMFYDVVQYVFSPWIAQRSDDIPPNCLGVEESFMDKCLDVYGKR